MKKAENIPVLAESRSSTIKPQKQSSLPPKSNAKKSPRLIFDNVAETLNNSQTNCTPRLASSTDNKMPEVFPIDQTQRVKTQLPPVRHHRANTTVNTTLLSKGMEKGTDFDLSNASKKSQHRAIDIVCLENKFNKLIHFDLEQSIAGCKQRLGDEIKVMLDRKIINSMSKFRT